MSSLFSFRKFPVGLVVVGRIAESLQMKFIDKFARRRNNSTTTNSNTSTLAIKIVYGTTTGTGKTFALNLVRLLKKNNTIAKEYNLKPLAINFSDYFTNLNNNNSIANLLQEESENRNPLIFITPCYGEGECTDDAKPFFNSITTIEKEKNLNLNLKTLNYCVFGLGSKSSYPERYQRAGRSLDSKLSELGAHRLLPFSEGDDSIRSNGSLEDDFALFVDKLTPILIKTYAHRRSLDSISSDSNVNDAVTTVNSDNNINNNNNNNNNINNNINYNNNNDNNNDFAFVLAKNGVCVPYEEKMMMRNPKLQQIRFLLDQNKELINVKDFPDMKQALRSTQLIHFDISQTNINYTAGDHLTIYPRNETNSVVKFLKSLRFLDDAPNISVFVKKNHEFPVEFPPGTSLLEVVARYLNISSTPSQVILDEFADTYMPNADSSEKERMRGYLKYFINLGKGIPKCYRPTWVDVIQDFPSLSVPLEHLLEVIPPMPLRSYSIASSPSIDKKSLELCVRVERSTSNVNMDEQFIVHGLGSWYLSNPYLCMHNINESDRHYCDAYVRISDFRLPQWNLNQTINPSVLLIAAGTGIAPLRGFIQELPKDSSSSLYFGCFHEHSDFLFRSEINEALKEKRLSKLVTAFSHDQPKMIFIQDKILEDGAHVWDELNSKNGCYIYVCGSQAMGVGVHRALLSICQTYGKMSEDEASNYLKEKIEKSHYQRDTF